MTDTDPPAGGPRTAYDEFAYPGQVFPQTHPDRMATLATLLGLSPASPSRCRVLEVGCGDGGNLLALALGAPGSTFYGFDLAASGIDKGRAMAGELGLENVRLFRADLMEYQPDAPFDYIIAHGFLSWVPPAVQMRLMQLCREALAPQGVAFVSYNTFPGCHLRRMLGEMMRYHTAAAPDARRRIDGARALMQFLIAGRAKDDEYASFLRAEAEWVMDRGSEALLVHDDLAEINVPYYFHEFAALAASHELQFLAEADYYEMNDGLFPEPAAKVLRQFGGDVLRREQYIDFLKCRRFRQTLLVHGGLPINRDVSPELTRRFMISSPAKPESEPVDLSPGVVEAFKGPRGGAMRIDHPLTKAATLVLQSLWPRPVPFAELASAAWEVLGGPPESGGEDDEAVLTEVLLNTHATGLTEFHLHRPHWAAEAGERPTASPLLRLQLRRGQDHVMSLRPVNVLIDVPLYQRVLMLLDGTRDRAALLRELRPAVESGELALPKKATPADLPAVIESCLCKAAEEALLVDQALHTDFLDRPKFAPNTAPRPNSGN